MIALLIFLWRLLLLPSRPEFLLEAEKAALRQYGGALASGRLLALLAVEVEKPGRPTADLSRIAGLDPADEP